LLHGSNIRIFLVFELLILVEGGDHRRRGGTWLVLWILLVINTT
jgi:hypothetical protein